MNKNKIAKILIPTFAILCFTPYLGSASALVLGVLIAIIFENPFPTQKYIHTLLALAVSGLGAGMNLITVAHVGMQGLGTTFISIFSVFIIGFLLIKILKIEKEAGLLITAGTAICGGSAIAAITPVIKAKPQSTTVALGTVFILNAIALIIFPPIGHYFHMSENNFGLWSALAIHDTSSVVGATIAYGKEAAVIGTTVKLARALWIVPLTLIFSYFIKNESDNKTKPKKPWFILWFLIMAALVTWIPAIKPIGIIIEMVARKIMVLTLFLIGLNLSKETIKSVGIKPFLLGLLLWILTGSITLFCILNKFITI